MLFADPPDACFNRYLYPITFSGPAQRDRMAKHLERDGIGTIKPMDDIADAARLHYAYASDCPTSERLAKSVLVIPSYAALSEKTVRRIAKSFNDGWRAEQRGN